MRRRWFPGIQTRRWSLWGCSSRSLFLRRRRRKEEGVKVGVGGGGGCGERRRRLGPGLS
ncbi:hypothetical protein RchiOBHm_Chr4g0404781 [Rosa chinensis]|uniref:Uncharacterized protein n=1 Tax=Rosa chinensis TaxID=74649 RepID=A0A2P6QTW3_ROSCH|nr:hypothetical protein RchiOBHm_Chr4g0404781 [Rosa chinensis]